MMTRRKMMMTNDSVRYSVDDDCAQKFILALIAICLVSVALTVHGFNTTFDPIVGSQKAEQILTNKKLLSKTSKGNPVMKKLLAEINSIRSNNANVDGLKARTEKMQPRNQEGDLLKVSVKKSEDEKQNSKLSGTRKEMTDYWKYHTSRKLDDSTMLLMENAGTFAEQEKREILSYCPDTKGLDVLEIGAGVGRFTGILAENAKHLTAVDFMQACIEQNRERNKHRTNVDFMQADATKLNFDNESLDFVFENWLFMYLSTEETEKLAANIAKWVRPGGYVFTRESTSGGASGDTPRPFNPTKYRSPEYYSKLWKSLGFEIEKTGQVQVYLKEKNKTNQYFWLLKKPTK